DSMIDTYKKMWRYMENKKPSVFVSTYKEGIDRVLEGNYAFLMESTMLDYIVQRNCNLTQIGGLLDSKGYGIATPMAESVLYYLCQLYEMSLHSGLCGVFVVLLCGLAIAIMVAIFEFCYNSKKTMRSDCTSPNPQAQSLCVEMTDELCFALKCRGSRQKPALRRKCPNCNTRATHLNLGLDLAPPPRPNSATGRSQRESICDIPPPPAPLYRSVMQHFIFFQLIKIVNMSVNTSSKCLRQSGRLSKFQPQPTTETTDIKSSLRHMGRKNYIEQDDDSDYCPLPRKKQRSSTINVSERKLSLRSKDVSSKATGSTSKDSFIFFQLIKIVNMSVNTSSKCLRQSGRLSKSQPQPTTETTDIKSSLRHMGRKNYIEQDDDSDYCPLPRKKQRSSTTNVSERKLSLDLDTT
ncbi:uncharacterized protein LOC113472452, partial [Diaphorina citri]|uniref:Uncharacterized protein LOC113472452 n=1 Tax=Diaphorina citri TaxID=121845 RepID=A0A3Q0JLI4_DIACI